MSSSSFWSGRKRSLFPCSLVKLLRRPAAAEGAVDKLGVAPTRGLFADGGPLGPDEALSLEEAARRIADIGPGVALVGNGAAVVTQAFPDLPFAHLDDRVAPSPEALARLAAAADPATHPPRPLYLRAPDATPPSRLPGQPRQPAP